MSFNLYLNSNNNENFVGMDTFFNEITSIKGSQFRFKYIEESPIKTQMDIFFLCLLIGFKKNVKENTKNYKSNEFSGNYLETYQNFSDLINGLYLAIKVEKELGKNANKNHILPSKPQDAKIIKIDRGGDVTYHGPGQLVGYPILDLHNYKMSISWYLKLLSNSIIDMLNDLNITSHYT